MSGTAKGTQVHQVGVLGAGCQVGVLGAGHQVGVLGAGHQVGVLGAGHQVGVLGAGHQVGGERLGAPGGMVQCKCGTCTLYMLVLQSF